MIWQPDNSTINANGVLYGQEFTGSPTYQFGGAACRCRRDLYCDWGGGSGFQEVVKKQFVDPDAGSGATGPSEHPVYDGFWPVSCSVEPFASKDTALKPPRAIVTNADINVYDKAKITLEYEAFPNWATLSASDNSFPGPSSGTLLRWKQGGGTEYLCIPGRHWKWDSDNVQLDEDTNPGVKVTRIQLMMQWMFVIKPPYSTINSTVGAVNTAKFMGYAAGTVCLLDWEEEYVPLPYSSNGAGYSNITYHFGVRLAHATNSDTATFGWNYFYRRKPTGENWETVSGFNSGKPPYRSVSFTSLFTDLH